VVPNRASTFAEPIFLTAGFLALFGGLAGALAVVGGWLSPSPTLVCHDLHAKQDRLDLFGLMQAQ